LPTSSIAVRLGAACVERAARQKHYTVMLLDTTNDPMAALGARAINGASIDGCIVYTGDVLSTTMWWLSARTLSDRGVSTKLVVYKVNIRAAADRP